MRAFAYRAVHTPGEAIAAVAADPDAAFVAGGTTLIDLMRHDVEAPGLVVDLNGLPLRRIVRRPGGGLRIGALARMSDVAEHRAVVSTFPALSQALLASASPQLRNMASIGGNLLQRTRCPYFRDTAVPCNKRQPGSGCPAVHGNNRTLAVLGTSDHCIASYPGDMAVALTAFDAVLHLHGPQGNRTVDLIDFYRQPGETPQDETVLGRGEMILSVDLPAAVHARRSCYVKVRDRASFEFALVSAAVGLDVQDGIIRSARVALGGVGTTPWRSAPAEAVLVGSRATHAVFEIAARAALTGAKPYSQNGFKIELAQRAVVRALDTVMESHS